MSKPFQFSMRRMFVAVAFFAIAIDWFVRLTMRTDRFPGVVAFTWIVGGIGAFAAIGVGLIIGRPIICTVWGIVLSPVGLGAYILFYWSLHPGRGYL